jgi:hypothetical protein
MTENGYSSTVICRIRIPDVYRRILGVCHDTSRNRNDVVRSPRLPRNPYWESLLYGPECELGNQGIVAQHPSGAEFSLRLSNASSLLFSGYLGDKAARA